MLQNRSFLFAALLLASSIGTGCGMSYGPTKSASGSSGSNTFYAADTSPSGGTQAATSTGTGTPIKVAIQGTGYDSHTVTLTTGSVLKVRFIAGKQNQQASGTFYPYSALGVYVGIGSFIQPTELIHNGYGGTTAEQSSVIDLSSYITTSCAGGADPKCRQKLSLTVSQPNDDDACLNQGYIYCPYQHVPSGHPWNGTLVIQTDDTTAI